MTNVTQRNLAVALIAVALMTNCVTIRRHPKATAIIMSAAAGAVVGGIIGHQASCKSYYNGVPYNGTPPCPVYCDSPGHCDWPPRK